MRSRVAVTVLLVIALLAPAGPVQAATVWDWKKVSARAVQFAQTVFENYRLATGIRDATVGKLDQIEQQTRELVGIREQFERQYVGELGGLGREVPDWLDYRTICDVTDNNVEACDVKNMTRARTPDLWRVSGLNAVRVEVLAASRNINRTIDSVAGARISETLTAGAYAATSPLRRISESQKYQNTRSGINGGIFGRLDVIEATLDSLLVTEGLNDRVSSGRATQITAYLSVLEAEVLLESILRDGLKLRTDAERTVSEITDLRQTLAPMPVW